MRQYKDLLENILAFGYQCEPAERQDVGTQQLNSYEFRHDLRDGFPLLTTKKLSFKNIVVELLWFLRGDTNIKYLVDNGCNIWNEDAYKYYLRRCKEWDMKDGFVFPIEEFLDMVKGNHKPTPMSDYTYGDLGPVYGKQWRSRTNWTVYQGNIKKNNPNANMQIFEDSAHPRNIDQIADLIKNIKNMIVNNTNNRRLIVDAWNPGELSQMALPPCHYGFQVILEPIPYGDRLRLGADMTDYNKNWVRPHDKDIPKYYINLKWNQRSVDTFLGLPYNIASYALLTHILSKITNTIPKELIGSLTAVHVYNSHKEQCKELLSREERDLPKLWIATEIDWEETVNEYNFQNLHHADFSVEGYNPYSNIKAQIVT